MLRVLFILLLRSFLKKINFNNWKQVWQIAWPLIVANSFWNLQITIDRVFLGQYSIDALAAVMAAVGVFWAPMALIQQTASYVMTFIAQYIGAKQPHMVGPSVWQSVYISVVGGVLFLGLIPLSSFVFYWFGHSQNIQALEIEYFNALCFSALPTALVAAASGFFTGLGRSKVIMLINCMGLIVNVILDYVLIFGNYGFPEMGVEGAGYATALANVAAAILGFYLVFKNENREKYNLTESWKYNSDLLKRFLKFGLPSGMQWALEGLGFTVFLIFIGRMPNGDAALAASSIAVTIMLLSALPAIGVAQAVSIMVGQCLGEKNPQKAEAYSWSGVQISMFYIILMGISFLCFPNFYLNWFHNAENKELWGELSVIVPYLLMFVALFTVFDSLNFVFSFALKGAGDTRFVTFVALLLPWPLMVPPTFLVSHLQTGVYWAWAAASLFIIVQALVFLWRFTGGKWKEMSVIH